MSNWSASPAVISALILAVLCFASVGRINAAAQTGSPYQITTPSLSAAAKRTTAPRGASVTHGDSELQRASDSVQALGGYAMAATLILLAAYYLSRGPVAIRSGLAHQTIERFTSFERVTHWVLAVSFIALAATGLMQLYAGTLLPVVFADDAYAAIVLSLRGTHAVAAFLFVASLMSSAFLWVKPSRLQRHDWERLKAVFSGPQRPERNKPTGKFDAGQKLHLWLLLLGGTIMVISGLALRDPFAYPMARYLAPLINTFGADVPPAPSSQIEYALATLVHRGVALILICAAFVHIYRRSIGITGALDAMVSGRVDLNWAKERHSLWVVGKEPRAHAAPDKER